MVAPPREFHCFSFIKLQLDTHQTQELVAVFNFKGREKTKSKLGVWWRWFKGLAIIRDLMLFLSCFGLGLPLVKCKDVV